MEAKRNGGGDHLNVLVCTACCPLFANADLGPDFVLRVIYFYASPGTDHAFSISNLAHTHLIGGLIRPRPPIRRRFECDKHCTP